MKKLITLTLALAICAAMSLTAFAANISTANGNASTPVKGSYSSSGRTDVYSVDISWGSMEFTYNAATEEWNKTTHEWDETGAASWSVANTADNKIEIKSHSSAAVTATLSYTADAAYSAVVGSFKDASAGGNAIAANSFALAAASAATANTTPDAVAYLQLSGGALTTGQTLVSIGTVTVTLS